MPTDKTVNTLIINTLTEEQYQTIENPSDEQLWATPLSPDSFLPSQTGHSGEFLTTNGTTPSWAEIPTDVDNKSVSLNSNDQIQTVGVIDQNDTTKAIKTWTGTKAQYDDIITKDADTIYNITDDTVFADFANTSLSNLTNAGKIVGAGLGMPSTTTKALTLGASGTTYTAPADGWVSFSTWSTATPISYFQLTNVASDIGILLVPNQGAGYQQKGYIPCRKGDTIYLAYGNIDTSRTALVFVYAEGSKSEANQ